MSQENPIDDEYGEFTEEVFHVFSEFLGKPDEDAYIAPIPIYLGGHADVRIFRKYIPGYTYVTSGLIEDGGQIQNSLGRYELMICTKYESEWASNFISELSSYTLKIKFEPGETMNAEGVFPTESELKKVLFHIPTTPCQGYDIRGVKCGLLLCIGITNKEFDVCHEQGSDIVVAKLNEQRIFPYTIPERHSVF